MFFKVHQNYTVIRLLINHLAEKFEDRRKPSIRTSVIYVLHDCLVLATDHGYNGHLNDAFFSAYGRKKHDVFHSRSDVIFRDPKIDRVSTEIVQSRKTIERGQ